MTSCQAAAVLQWAVVVAAIASGLLWIKAARIRVRPTGGTLDGPPKDVVLAYNAQSRWNAYAAYASATAALGQALVTALGSGCH